MGIHKKISMYILKVSIYIKGEHIYKNSLFSKQKLVF